MFCHTVPATFSDSNSRSSLFLLITPEPFCDKPRSLRSLDTIRTQTKMSLPKLTYAQAASDPTDWEELVDSLGQDEVTHQGTVGLPPLSAASSKKKREFSAHMLYCVLLLTGKIDYRP